MPGRSTVFVLVRLFQLTPKSSTVQDVVLPRPDLEEGRHTGSGPSLRRRRWFSPMVVLCPLPVPASPRR
ncbi:MAG TPA: hypothetical protein VNP37_07625 [Actinomycetospora sp.]|nr:hypothetical protein [Actinomycetospora sp.]